MNDADFLDWSDEDYAAYGREPWLARHRLHDDPMFSDESLIKILDDYPRHELQGFTMGHDIAQAEDWATVDIGDASGAQLWRAVSEGRLWLNLLWVERFDTRFARVLETMYERLSARVDQLANYEQPHLTMLLSSPNALVYYHFDAEDNMLWHVRGEKTMWIYPQSNVDMLPEGMAEDIFSRSRNEDLPYDPSYDADATLLKMIPGDVASWPHTSPHRIVNSDSLNVSLSTSVVTPASKRRELTHSANRWLRHHTPANRLSTRETGAGAASKRFVYRVAKRLGGVPKPPGIDYVARHQVDPEAANGVRVLDEPVRTIYSKA